MAASIADRDSGVETGSFRDRDSRVLLADQRVFRVLSAQGLSDWKALAASELIGRHVSDGSLISASEISLDRLPAAARAAALPEAAVAALEHPMLAAVSYPYEWTFGMLKDAALLQLSLIEEALGEGLILKDASPYNVQWRGAGPVFIDVGSFEQLQPGEPWAGYRQFCCLNLYPLMVQAHLGVPFSTFLRGSLEGIEPQSCSRLLRGRHRFRRGVMSHVHLHARLERSNERSAGRQVRGELRRADFGVELIRANVRKLTRVVDGLRWKPGETAWTSYRATSTYTDQDTEAKERFVRRAGDVAPAVTWDIGCNDGHYSRIAAEWSDVVLALDNDQATVEALYRALRDEGNTKILPLVFDAVDPSPALGWRNAERRTLSQRSKPELVLALAVVHHLSITANVPIEEIISWFHSLDASLVVEFVDRDDPMAERLLSAKRPGANRDYSRETFEKALHASFEVSETTALPSGTRVLYRAQPKSRA